MYEIKPDSPLTICCACNREYHNKMNLSIDKYDICGECYSQYIDDRIAAWQSVKDRWLSRLASNDLAAGAITAL